MHMRDLLVRGMLAGCLASVVAFGVATVIGEPPIDAAIAIEAQRAAAVHAHGDAAEDDAPVSRGVQRTIGLLAGMAVLGVALGGLLAVVFALTHRRVGTLGVRGTACGVAALGFLAVYLVPFLKYPPNPPAVGDPDTIAMRTGAYLGLLLISVLLVVGAAWLQRVLTDRLGAWRASLSAAAAFALGVAVVFLVLPGVREVPVDFPVDVLWRFRLASLATQLALWSTLGLAFGALVERGRR